MSSGSVSRSPYSYVCSLDVVQKQLDVNLFGVIRLITTVLPNMRQKHSGTIVFMNSVFAHGANPFGAAYSASKHPVAGK